MSLSINRDERTFCFPHKNPVSYRNLYCVNVVSKDWNDSHFVSGPTICYQYIDGNSYMQQFSGTEAEAEIFCGDLNEAIYLSNHPFP